MTDIDYETLAKAAHHEYCDPNHTIVDLARAVVAAYQAQQREQGVVEVRAEDLDRTIDWYALKVPPYTQDDRDTYDRIRAALAAPGEDGEDTDG